MSLLFLNKVKMVDFDTTEKNFSYSVRINLKLKIYLWFECENSEIKQKSYSDLYQLSKLGKHMYTDAYIQTHIQVLIES